MKKILAIDYGEKRIGIAISDEKHTFSFPKFTIDTEKNPDLLQTIKSFVQDNDIGTIVIGNPLNVEGKDSNKSPKIKKFASELKKIVEVTVKFWDESYTTEKAKKVLHNSSKSFKNNKNKLDQIAASFILEDYLKNH